MCDVPNVVQSFSKSFLSAGIIDYHCDPSCCRIHHAPSWWCANMNHYHDSWSTFVHTWHGLLSRFFSSNPELSGPRAVILVFFEIFEKEFLRSFLLLHSSGTEKNQIRNHHLSLGHHRSTCRVAPELPELPGETALERLEAALGPQARLLATSAEALLPCLEERLKNALMKELQHLLGRTSGALPSEKELRSIGAMPVCV
ncbi:unnamed protein product [Durusdinium trenchii]|uniref:Uncharacterized protein n=1 Tax=Durusdinium trenchii TaxID=1381693 RepID=A0ABP0KXA5_9DINO